MEENAPEGLQYIITVPAVFGLISITVRPLQPAAAQALLLLALLCWHELHFTVRAAVLLPVLTSEKHFLSLCSPDPAASLSISISFICSAAACSENDPVMFWRRKEMPPLPFLPRNTASFWCLLTWYCGSIHCNPYDRCR